MSKPHWEDWAEKPRIIGEGKVGATLTVDEGAPFFSGTPDDRPEQRDLPHVRSRSDTSLGSLKTEWIQDGRKVSEHTSFTVPADARSVQAVLTIYITEYDQLGRPNGYSQGSAATQVVTVAGAPPPPPLPTPTGDDYAKGALEFAKKALAAWEAAGVSKAKRENTAAFVAGAWKQADQATRDRVRALLDDGGE